MGCFGYICRGCRTSIRGDSSVGGESCVLIHIRHGQEMGRVEGHYNSYGGVIEQSNLSEDKRFDGNGKGVNSHESICASTYRCDDSYVEVKNLRIYNGEVINFGTYLRRVLKKDLKKVDYNFCNLPYYSILDTARSSNKRINDLLNICEQNYKNYKVDEFAQYRIYLCLSEVLTDELRNYFWNRKDKYFGFNFRKLKKPAYEGYSGIVAYHSLCYKEALEKNTFNLIPSDLDEDQSWGEIRKKFC